MEKINKNFNKILEEMKGNEFSIIMLSNESIHWTKDISGIFLRDMFFTEEPREELYGDAGAIDKGAIGLQTLIKEKNGFEHEFTVFLNYDFMKALKQYAKELQKEGLDDLISETMKRIESKISDRSAFEWFEKGFEEAQIKRKIREEEELVKKEEKEELAKKEEERKRKIQEEEERKRKIQAEKDAWIESIIEDEQAIINEEIRERMKAEREKTQEQKEEERRKAEQELRESRKDEEEEIRKAVREKFKKQNNN